MGTRLQKNTGHTITNLKPGLIPLECHEKSLCKEMQGLSLKNVAIKLIDKTKDKIIYEDFGEMMFTHFGVTGPIVISSSSHLIRYKNIEELLKNRNIELKIDLKPALDIEKLDLRIRRDFKELKNKQFKNSLNGLLPRKMIEPVIGLSKINPDKKINEIKREERLKLGEIIKNFKLNISGFRPIDEAIITSRRSFSKRDKPKNHGI